MNRRAVIVCLAVVSAMAGCSSDPARPKPAPSPYHSLSEQSAVLFNLELAMNKMDAAHYVDVLDPDNFTFFFSPGDVGGDVPESWGFASEQHSAETMFNKGGGKANNPILSIDLTLDRASESWVEFDPTSAPGVFETTVRYSYKIDTENETTYITSGTERARFRIKQDDGGKWHIVEWADMSSFRAAPAATEESTWGKVKALYQ